MLFKSGVTLSIKMILHSKHTQTNGVLYRMSESMICSGTNGLGKPYLTFFDQCTHSQIMRMGQRT